MTGVNIYFKLDDGVFPATMEENDIIHEAATKTLKIPDDLYSLYAGEMTLDKEMRICDSPLANQDTVQIVFDRKKALFLEAKKVTPKLSCDQKSIAEAISRVEKWDGSMFPALELLKLIQDEEGIGSEADSESDTDTEYDSDGDKVEKDDKIYFEMVNGDSFNDLLVYFSKKGNLDLVRILMGYISNADAKDCKGDTALLCHVIKGRKNVEIVRTLLDNGANIDAVTRRNNDSTLTLAVYKGYTDIVRLLIERGADLDIVTDGSNKTAISLAVERKHLEIAELLLDAGANSNMGNGSSLCFAIHYNFHEFALKLLDKGADVNKIYNGVSPLCMAANNAFLPIVEKLLKKGAHLNYISKNGYIPFSAACLHGNIETAKLLLEGSNIHIGRWPSICIVASKGRVEFLDMLVEAGADFESKNDRGFDSLAIAVSHRQLEFVRALFNRGYAPGRDSYIKAIDCALKCKYSDIAIEIIERCPEIRLVKSEAMNIFCTISEHDMVEVAERWIEKYPFSDHYYNLEEKRSTPSRVKILKKVVYTTKVWNFLLSGKTLLMYAASNGDIELVRDLVDKGVDINVTDVNGWSALTYASTYGHSEIVSELAGYHGRK